MRPAVGQVHGAECTHESEERQRRDELQSPQAQAKQDRAPRGDYGDGHGKAAKPSASSDPAHARTEARDRGEQHDVGPVGGHGEAVDQRVRPVVGRGAEP
jgi:hypothetical protein